MSGCFCDTVTGSAGTIAGSAAGSILPIAAGLIVPRTMSFLDTIVPGVGTLFKAGRIIANLQCFSSVSSATAGTEGGLVGVVADGTKRICKY